MVEFLSAFTPILVSSAIAAWAAWHASERHALTANVIGERAKWRDRLRSLAEELQKAVSTSDAAEIRRLRLAFRLSLNPWDDRDRELVALMGLLMDRAGDGELFEQIAVRLELLLKHDWERAKAEASWRGWSRRATPARRASLPRAGVESLSRLRLQRPLADEFQEREAF